MLSHRHRSNGLNDSDDQNPMKQQEWDHFMQKHDHYINKVYRCNFVKSYVSTFNSEEFTLKTPKKSPNR